MALFKNSTDASSEPLDFPSVKKGWDPEHVTTYVQGMTDQHEEELQAVVERLRVVQGEEEKTRAAAEAQIARLEEEREHITARLEEATTHVQASSEQIEELEKELEKRKMASGEIAYDSEGLKTLQEENQHLIALKYELEQELTATKETLRQTQEELQTVTAQLAEAKQQLQTAQEELQAKQTQLEQAQTQLNEVQAQNESLQAQLSAAQTQLAEAEKYVQQTEAVYDERDRLVSELTTLQSHGDAGELLTQLQTAQATVADLQASLQATQTRADAAQEELRDIRQEGTGIQTQYHELAEEKKGLLALMDEIERQKASFKQQLEDTRALHHDALRQSAAAEAQVQTQHAQIVGLQTEIDRIRREQPSIGDTAQRMMKALEEARVEHEAEMDRAMQAAQADADQLRSQAAEEAAEITQRSIASMDESIDRYYARLETIQAEKKSLESTIENGVGWLQQETENILISTKEAYSQSFDEFIDKYRRDYRSMIEERGELLSEIAELEARRNAVIDQLNRFARPSTEQPEVQSVTASPSLSSNDLPDPFAPIAPDPFVPAIVAPLESEPFSLPSNDDLLPYHEELSPTMPAIEETPYATLGEATKELFPDPSAGETLDMEHPIVLNDETDSQLSPRANAPTFGTDAPVPLDIEAPEFTLSEESAQALPTPENIDTPPTDPKWQVWEHFGQNNESGSEPTTQVDPSTANGADLNTAPPTAAPNFTVEPIDELPTEPIIADPPMTVLPEPPVFKDLPVPEIAPIPEAAADESNDEKKSVADLANMNAPQQTRKADDDSIQAEVTEERVARIFTEED